MVALQLSEKQVAVHRGSYDAAVRQIGQELQRLGLPGLESALAHLSGLYEAARDLEAAVAASNEQPLQPPINHVPEQPRLPVRNNNAA